MNRIRSEGNAMTKRLVLWGDTGSGKTSLIASALSRDPLMSMISAKDVDPQLLRLRKMYADLSEGLMPDGTGGIEKFQPHFDGGGVLTVFDIMGAAAHRDRDSNTEELLRDSDGVLFVLPCDEERLGAAMLAITNTVTARMTKDKHVGLVLTKCEQLFPADSPVWDSGPEACPDKASEDRSRVVRAAGQAMQKLQGDRIQKARNAMLREIPSLAKYLLLFGDAWWATSVYGFDSNSAQFGNKSDWRPTKLNKGDWRPAMLLDEFGGTFPYNIDPINVEKPFQWMLENLELVNFASSDN